VTRLHPVRRFFSRVVIDRLELMACGVGVGDTEEQQRVLKDGSVINQIRAPFWTAPSSPEELGMTGRTLTLFTYGTPNFGLGCLYGHGQ